MRSHFIPSPGALVACAVSSATAMLPSVCSAQYSAADYATDPAYASGFTAGLNGGYGFSAWSFNGTDPTPAGIYQGMSSSSALGTAWTLSSHSTSTGLANAGRGINGGLQVGQTFETFIQNPTTTAGFYTYRGFDILFTSGTDNNPGGVNTAAIRAQVFDYYNSNLHWAMKDAGGSFNTPITGPTTGAQGARLDLTLTSSTAYTFTLTPLNGATPYSESGTYAGPITWVDFRLYNAASGGLDDTANNFEVSGMTITSVPEPSSLALIGLASAGLLLMRRRE